MPTKPEDRREDAPRTDLPPEKEPYYEGYFGTDEEEGVVREREESGDEERAERRGAEDSAGGDREIE
jgi:hypothetical protein